MKNKVIIILMTISIFVVSIFTGMYVYKIFNKKEEKIANLNELYSNYTINTEKNIVEIENAIVNANSREEKITPNTKFVLRKYYEECGHSINEYVELPQELINMTKEELEKQYKDWNVYTFSENEVILIKNINDYCDQHYILKELDGYVGVYKVDENGKENLVEKTGISTQYLTTTDLSHLKSEIKIYGLENLNKYLEDFE
jgi:hypothetical protein